MSKGLAKKAVSGSFLLAARQIGIIIVGFTGNLILARILIPADFGIYAIIQFVLTFLTLAGDGGLGAALIRKKGEISAHEIASIFTFQQVFMAVLTILFLVVTLFLKPFVKEASSLLLFRLSAISYMLLSFRIMPVMMLERNMRFGKIAVLEVAEVVAFQATAVILAFCKAGALALVGGLIAKNIATLIILFFISDWKIKYAWDMSMVKAVIPFGISFQAFHFINFLKDSFVPIFISSLLGMAAVGFINWAAMIVNYPLIAAGMISRILFPFFSKLQDDSEKFRKAMELIISMNVFFVFGILAVIWGMSGPITAVLYTDKWKPALVLFNFFIVSNLIVTVTLPLASAFNAIGKANLNLTYSVVWACLTWIFASIFVPKLGIAGYGLAALLTTLTNFKYMYDAVKHFNISFVKPVLPGLFAFIIAAAGLKYISVKAPAGNVLILLLECGFGFLAYAALAIIFSAGRYMTGIKLIAEKAMNKEAV